MLPSPCWFLLPGRCWELSTLTPLIVFWQPRSMTKKPPSSAIHLVFPSPSFLNSLSAVQAPRFFSSFAILAFPHVVVADAGCQCCDKTNSRAWTPFDKEHMVTFANVSSFWSSEVSPTRDALLDWIWWIWPAPQLMIWQMAFSEIWFWEIQIDEEHATKINQIG